MFEDSSTGKTHYSCPTRMKDKTFGCCNPECLNPHDDCDYQVLEGVAYTSTLTEDGLKEIELRGRLAWGYVAVMMIWGGIVLLWWIAVK